MPNRDGSDDEGLRIAIDVSQIHLLISQYIRSMKEIVVQTG